MQRARNLDHQAAHADHAAINLDTVEFIELLGKRLHRQPPVICRSRRRRGRKRMVTSPPTFLIACLPGTLIIAVSSKSRGRLTHPGRRGESFESVSAET